MKYPFVISVFASASVAAFVENPFHVILLCTAASVLLFGLLYPSLLAAPAAFLSAFRKCSGNKAASSVRKCTVETPAAQISGIPFSKNSPKAMNSGKPVIMLAEADAEFRTCLENCLSPEYVIRSFGDGAAAWDCLQKEHIDVVVGNLRLPEINGAELSLKLKSDTKTSFIPVILYTSVACSDWHYKRQASLANTFLLLPFAAEELKVEIAVLIQNVYIVRRASLEKILGDLFLRIEDAADAEDADWCFFHQVKDFILENMDCEDLKIEDIASHVHLCQTSFYKRWKSLTGKTPSSFLLALRMEKARALLESGKYLVADIPVMVGIKDDKYFRTVYKKYFGMTPSQSIKKG